MIVTFKGIGELDEVIIRYAVRKSVAGWAINQLKKVVVSDAIATCIQGFSFV